MKIEWMSDATRKSNLNGIGMAKHKLCHLLGNNFPSFIYLFAGVHCISSYIDIITLLNWYTTPNEFRLEVDIERALVFPKCVICAVDPTFKSYRPTKMQIPRTINNARVIIWNADLPVATGQWLPIMP